MPKPVYGVLASPSAAAAAHGTFSEDGKDTWPAERERVLL